MFADNKREYDIGVGTGFEDVLKTTKDSGHSQYKNHKILNAENNECMLSESIIGDYEIGKCFSHIITFHI